MIARACPAEAVERLFAQLQRSLVDISHRSQALEEPVAPAAVSRAWAWRRRASWAEPLSPRGHSAERAAPAGRSCRLPSAGASPPAPVPFALSPDHASAAAAHGLPRAPHRARLAFQTTDQSVRADPRCPSFGRHALHRPATFRPAGASGTAARLPLLPTTVSSLPPGKLPHGRRPSHAGVACFDPLAASFRGGYVGMA